MTSQPSTRNVSTKHHTTLKIILVISLILNLLFVIAYATTVYMFRSGDYDLALHNYYQQSYCSDEWNKKLHELTLNSPQGSVERADTMVAINDYHCQAEDALRYYNDGLNAYLKSRGLSAED